MKSHTCQHCNKIIEKSTSKKFCNSSCAASFNNKLFPKRKPIASKLTNCLHCNKEFTFKETQTKGKFCGTKCCGNFRTKQTIALFYEGKLSDGGTLRSIMLKLFPQKCSVCNLSDWFGKPMPVWVDHIDGCASNNAPSNLRFICPNCDTFNSTFGGRNKGKGRKILGIKK